MNITFFEMSARQKTISNFGRRMMQISEDNLTNIPLEICNAMSRIGEELAETAQVKDLTKEDKMVIQYTKQLMKGAA
jgi:hypothetical protein